ncbi:hypothetical protein BH10CYA1_BH10CYA1_40650 [soil metagenome]
MPTEDFTQKLTDDQTNKQTDKLTRDIYAQLIDDFSKDNGKKGPSYDKDFEIAREKLKGVLPGLTLVDNGGHDVGTGLRVTDTGIVGKPGETYTIDPKTGIGRSDDGAIQAIVTPDGKIQRFDYDGNNPDGTPKLVSVTDANGTTYSINPETGKATYTAVVNGIEQTIQTNGKLSIDQGSGKITIKNDDGTREEHNIDGSMVKYDNHKNAQGKDDPRVTEVRFGYDLKDHNKRDSMKFTYDDQGLVSVENQKKETWTKKDGKWVSSVVGPDGNPYTSDADFSVDSTGNVTIRHAHDRETYHPDGTMDKVYIEPNSTTTTVSSDRYGKIKEISASNGRNIAIKWDGDKESEVKLPDGSSYKRAANGWTDQKGAKTNVEDIKVFADGTVVVFNKDRTSTTYKNGNPVIQPGAPQPTPGRGGPF